MKESLLQYLVCPTCRGDLHLGLHNKVRASGEIRSGTLNCLRCRVEFPIKNYIPRFVSADNYASSFGVEWKAHARTQIDTFSGTDITERRFRSATGWPTRLEGQRVLEAGCGAGRFTEIALKAGAEVVSFDLSEAVESCLDNHGLAKSLHLFQGDIYRLPLKDSVFDKIFCFGVLQHCPDVPAAFQKLVPPLAPRGELAIDIYEKNYKIYVTPRYWLRLVTTHIPPERLYSLVERAVPVLLPIRTWIRERVPIIGRYLAITIPVAYYKGILPLSERQLLEWSILDTFDILSPRYEYRARMNEVREWFRQAGLNNIKVDWGGTGIVGLGSRDHDNGSGYANGKNTNVQ